MKICSWQFEELNFHDEKINNVEDGNYVIPKKLCVNICSAGIQDGVTYWCFKRISVT